MKGAPRSFFELGFRESLERSLDVERRCLDLARQREAQRRFDELTRRQRVFLRLPSRDRRIDPYPQLEHVEAMQAPSLSLLLAIAAGLLLIFAVVGAFLFFHVGMLTEVKAAKSPFALYATALVFGGAFGLVLVATLVHFLRQLQNPVYWESACWILVAAGIFARQLMSAGDKLAPSLGAVVVSAVVALATLPGMMRWLNRIPAQPGLAHVTVPFSLGFFVDLTQVLTSKYVMQLPWLPR